jgi:hypothetical protein
MFAGSLTLNIIGSAGEVAVSILASQLNQSVLLHTHIIE